MKLRIQFHKLGPVRFTSHKDTIRMFQRCFASCGIPVTYSQGFHPHMKLSFAPPLKTGWEGHEEYMDVQVDGPPGEIRDTCNARLPEGLRIGHVYVLNDRAPKIAADVRAAVVVARIGAADVFGEGVDDPQRRTERMLELEGGPRPGAEDPRIIEWAVGDDGGEVEVRYTTTMVSGKIVGPAEVVAELIGDPEEFETPMRVARKAQFVERDGELVSPISKGVLLNQS